MSYIDQRSSPKNDMASHQDCVFLFDIFHGKYNNCGNTAKNTVQWWIESIWNTTTLLFGTGRPY